MPEFKTAQIVTADDLNAIPPVGSITMWPTASPPAGWLICDGSSFSAATYPELSAVLGGTSLPDLQDRVPVGSSGTKSELSTGGAASVTLTTTQLPAHAHGVNINTGTVSADHSHSVSSLLKTNNPGGVGSDNGGNSVVQGTTAGRFNAGQSGSTGGISANHVHNVNGNTASAGSGAAFSVQNPYVALNFIIRAA